MDELKLQLDKLHELHQLDSALLELGKLAETLPKKIDQLAETVAIVKAELKAVDERLAILDKEKRRLEGEVKLEEEHLKKGQARLMAVRTNEELHAVQKELEFSKTENSKREDQIIVIMEEQEILEVQKKNTKQAFDEKTKIHTQEVAVLETDLQKAKQQQQTLQTQRQAKAKDLTGNPLLAPYETVRQRQGTGMVEVSTTACPICQMSLTHHVLNEVMANKKMHQCPNCFRILYYIKPPENQEGKKTSASGASSGAAIV